MVKRSYIMNKVKYGGKTYTHTCCRRVTNVKNTNTCTSTSVQGGTVIILKVHHMEEA